MFRGIREIWSLLRAVQGSEKSYSVMVIPNDGGEMTTHNVHGSNVSSLLHIFSIAFALIAMSMGAVYYVIYTGWADRDQLKEYYTAKQAQDKRIEEIQSMTESLQHELSEVEKLKKSVLEEMQKAGMDLPTVSGAQDKRSGQGGPIFGFGGDRTNTQIKVMEEQNYNLVYNLELLRQDISKMQKVIRQDNYKKEVTPDIWPVDNGWISSEFGRRQDPVTGEYGSFHPGLDIAADHGEPVYAAASGRITHAGWYPGYGKYVEIEHDYGYATAYGHLSSINVNVNGYVVKGQFIGRVGSTGYSTGPHLHYEVLLWNEQINPRDMLIKSRLGGN